VQVGDMKTIDTYTDATGQVVTDPSQAVRLDRDIYDDTGKLVRREWYNRTGTPKAGEEVQLSDPNHQPASAPGSVGDQPRRRRRCPTRCRSVLRESRRSPERRVRRFDRSGPPGRFDRDPEPVHEIAAQPSRDHEDGDGNHGQRERHTWIDRP